MTHIEQAIKEAVEKGGYENGALAMIEGAISQSQIDMTVNICLLDPFFWRALGKALGWDEGKHGDMTYMFAPTNMPMWKWKWHRFIDHLAEGKDAESFFATLV